MGTKYLLLQEIEQAPEYLLAEVLDFCLMLVTARLALLQLRETESKLGGLIPLFAGLR